MSTKMTSTLWRGKTVIRFLAKFKQYKTQRNNHLLTDYKLTKLHKRIKTNETAEAASCNELIKTDDENKKDAEESHQEEKNACKPNTDKLTITDTGKTDEYNNRHFPNISVYYVNDFKSTYKQDKIIKPTVIAIGTELVSEDGMLSKKISENDDSREESFDDLEENMLQTLKYDEKLQKNYKQCKDEKCPYDEFLRKHNFTIGYQRDINMFVKPKPKIKMSETQGFQEDERKIKNKFQSEEDQKVGTELGRNEILQKKSGILNYRLNHDNFNEDSVDDPRCIDSKTKDSLKSRKYSSYSSLENAPKNNEVPYEMETANDRLATACEEDIVENDLIKFKIPQDSFTKETETKHFSEVLPGKSEERLDLGEENESFKERPEVETPQSDFNDEHQLEDKSDSQHLKKTYNVCENQHLKYFRIFMDSRKYFSTTKSKSVDDVSLLVYRGISKRHLKAVISSILGNDSEKRKPLPSNEPIFMRLNLQEEKPKIESLDLEKIPQNISNNNSEVESFDLGKSPENMNDNSEVETNLSMYSNENYKLNKTSSHENDIPLKLASHAVPFKSYTESNMFTNSDYKRSLQMRLKASQLKKSTCKSKKRRRKIKYQKQSRYQGILISHNKPTNSFSKTFVSDISQNFDKPNDLPKLKYNIPNSAIREEKSIGQVVEVKEKIGEAIEKKVSEIFKHEKKEPTVKVSDYLLNKNSDIGLKNSENDVRDSKKSDELIDEPQKDDNKISHPNGNLSKFIPSKGISSNYEFTTNQLKEKKNSGRNIELPLANESTKREKRIKNEESTLKKGNSIKYDTINKEDSIHDIRTITYDTISIGPNKYYDSSKENFYKGYNHSFGTTDFEEQSSKKVFRHYIKDRVGNFDKSLKKNKLKNPSSLLPNQNASFSYLSKKSVKVDEENKNRGTVALRLEGKSTPKLSFNSSHTSTKMKFSKPNLIHSNDEKQKPSVGQSYFQNNRKGLVLKKENLNISPDSKLLKYVSNVKKYIISGIPKSYDFKDLQKFYKNLRKSLDNKTSDEQLKNNVYFLVPKHTPRSKLHQTYKLKSTNTRMRSFSDVTSKIKYNSNLDVSLKTYGLTPSKNKTQKLSAKTFNNANEFFLSKKRHGLDFLNKDKMKSGDNKEANKAMLSSHGISMPENSDDKEMDTLQTIKPAVKLLRKNDETFFLKDKFYANVSKHREGILTASDVMYKQRKNTSKSELNGIVNVLSSGHKEQNRMDISKSTITDQSKFKININKNSSNNLDKYITHIKKKNNHNRSIVDENYLFMKSKPITPTALSAQSKITTGITRNTLRSRVNAINTSNDKEPSIKARQNRSIDIGQKLFPEYENPIYKHSKSGSNQTRSKSSALEDLTRIIDKTDIENYFFKKPSLKYTIHKPNIKKGMNDITKELHSIKTDVLKTIKNIDNGKFAVQSVNTTDIITNTFKKRLSQLKQHKKKLNENFYGKKEDSEKKHVKTYKTNYATLKKKQGSDDYNFYTLKDKTKKLKITIPNRYEIKTIKSTPDKKDFANLKVPDTKSAGIRQSKSGTEIGMFDRFKKLKTNSSINLQSIKINVKAKNSYTDKNHPKSFSDFSSKIPKSREYITEENIYTVPKIYNKKLHSSNTLSINIPSNTNSNISMLSHKMSGQISDQKLMYNSKKLKKRDFIASTTGSKTLPILKKQYKPTINYSNIRRAKSQERQFPKTRSTLNEIKDKIKTNLTPFKIMNKNKSVPKQLLKNDINNIKKFDDSFYKSSDVSVNVGYKIAFSPDTFYLNNPIERSIRNNEMNLRKSKDRNINKKIDYNSINNYQSSYGELKPTYSYSKKYTNKSIIDNNKNRNNTFLYERRKN